MTGSNTLTGYGGTPMITEDGDSSLPGMRYWSHSKEGTEADSMVPALLLKGRRRLAGDDLLRRPTPTSFENKLQITLGCHTKF
jgi:hypothetical protein